ncbi:hypothetical protein V2I01_24870 [Micromonospora sp. BRA006-A]|nr:hypothetical protein [Micromonospora sp. BRA006-A]
MLVAVSLCFSAVQTREVAKQSRINNGIGSATALMEVNNLSRAWHDRLLENPPLRAYFFDRKPSAPTDTDRSVVITLAELLADVLECELQVAGLLPDSIRPLLAPMARAHAGAEARPGRGGGEPPRLVATLHELWRSTGESHPAAVTHPLVDGAAATPAHVPRRRR